MGRSRLRQVSFALLALAITCGCGKSESPMGPGPLTGPTGPTGPTHLLTAVLVGAGDIAQCDNDGGKHAEDTGKLLDRIQYDAVFTAGDTAYFNGTTQEYANCYEPRWGRHKRRTYPSPGNHEYGTPGAVPYFQYFGGNAGDFGLGYYSYNLGAWHLVSLNSMDQISVGNPQYVWLNDDLRVNAPRCTLVYFHHPRFTSSLSGGGGYKDVWDLMYSRGVDVVVNGHDHGYERFEPQRSDGVPDPGLGIREFVVGTGGASMYSFIRNAPNSVVKISRYGVIKFTLRNLDYDWAFIEAVSEQTLDFGSALCH